MLQANYSKKILMDVAQQIKDTGTSILDFQTWDTKKQTKV